MYILSVPKKVSILKEKNSFANPGGLKVVMKVTGLR